MLTIKTILVLVLVQHGFSTIKFKVSAKSNRKNIQNFKNVSKTKNFAKDGSLSSSLESTFADLDSSEENGKFLSQDQDSNKNDQSNVDNNEILIKKEIISKKEQENPQNTNEVINSDSSNDQLQDQSFKAVEDNGLSNKNIPILEQNLEN